MCVCARALSSCVASRALYLSLSLSISLFLCLSLFLSRAHIRDIDVLSCYNRGDATFPYPLSPSLPFSTFPYLAMTLAPFSKYARDGKCIFFDTPPSRACLLPASLQATPGMVLPPNKKLDETRPTEIINALLEFSPRYFF